MVSEAWKMDTLWTSAIFCVCLFINSVTGMVFVIQPENKFTVAGASVYWHCVAESTESQPQPITYKWSQNGITLPTSGDRHLIYTNGTLSINLIRDSDEGVYQCTASEGAAVRVITSPPVSLVVAYIDPVFSSQPASQTRDRGSSAVFECSIDSKPPPLITWVHNDNDVERPGVMITDVISRLSVDVTYDSKGRYQCKAKNSVTNETKYSNTAVLTVQGGPVWVIQPEPTSANRNSIKFLHCVAEANPAARVTWYSVQGVGQERVIRNDGRFLVFDNGTLRITDLTIGDEGFYKCEVANERGSIDKTILLTVTELPVEPVFVATPTDTKVREGDTVTWICEAIGQPSPIIIWSKESTVLGGDRISHPYPGALMIHPSSRTDTDWYTCTAENQAGILRHRFYLDVQYPPSLLDFAPPVLAVNTGDIVHMPCVIDSNPRPQIAWDTPFDDTFTESNGITIHGNGSLTIQTASPVHNGQYTCRGSNNLGFVTQGTLLQVTGEPMFITRPESQTAILDDTLLLHCEAAGYPSPDTTWYLPPDSLPISYGVNNDSVREVLENGTLRISPVTVPHEGTYLCVVNNSLGRVEGLADISVLGVPQFNESRETLVRYIGEDVMMDCEPTGRPIPLVQWAKDGLALRNDGNMTTFGNSSLYIETIYPSHYGTYQCYATNAVGSAMKEIMLLEPNAPVFITYPNNMTGNESSPLHIPCEAQSTLPVEVNWYFTHTYIPTAPYNNSLTRDDDFLFNVSQPRVYVRADGTLVFEDLTNYDEGWYVCAADNIMGNISTSIYLNVQIPPKIILASTPKSGDVGESTTLTCLVEGDPRPEFRWTTPHGEVITGTTGQYVVSPGVLTILVTMVEVHMGLWDCEACNMLGCANAGIDLYVRGPPKIMQVESYMDGNARVIRCSAEGTPFPEVRYYWGDLAISPLVPPRGHSISAEGPSLRISRDRIDTLSYKCRALNQYGKDTREFSVPSPPYDLAIINVTSSTTGLAWTSPDHPGGLPELYYTIEHTVVTPDHPDKFMSMTVEGVTGSPHDVTGLGAYTDYTFRVAAYNVLGNSVYSGVVQTRTYEDAPGPVRNLVMGFAGEVIHVTWQEPLKMNGNTSNIEYRIQSISDNNREVLELLVVKHGGPLETYLTNLHYDHGIMVIVEAVNTGIGKTSTPRQDHFQVKHKIPFLVPELIRIASMDPTSINVGWKYNDFEAGSISGFLIKVTYKEQDRLQQLTRTVDGYTVREHELTGLEERQTYGVSVAAFSREGPGPYSAEQFVTTNYAVFSPKAYEATNKLSMSGTKIAIIFGSILGILLFLVVVLLVWQWLRLHRQKREKMVDDVYGDKHRYLVYPGTAGEITMRAPHAPRPQVAPQPKPSKQPISRKPRPKVKVNEMKLPELKPIKIPRHKPSISKSYGPGRAYKYEVSPQVPVSDKTTLFKKKDASEPILAYSEIPGPMAVHRIPDSGLRDPRLSHPGARAGYPGQPRPDPRFHRPALTTPSGPSYRPTRPMYPGAKRVLPTPNLTASQENLANQQRRSPDRAVPASRRPDSPPDPQTASGLRSARVRKPPDRPPLHPQTVPGYTRTPPEQQNSSPAQTRTPPPEQQNSPPAQTRASPVPPSPPTAKGTLNSPYSASTESIPSRLNEAHPLPHEGRATPVPSEEEEEEDQPVKEWLNAPVDEPVYAIPDKLLKESSKPESDQHPGENPDESSGMSEPETNLPELALDRKGRVFHSPSKVKKPVPKGKSGGRTQAKNLGRAPLPMADFWGGDRDLDDIGPTTPI